MKLERTAVLVSMVGGLLSLACGSNTPPATPAPVKDSEVRTWADAELLPYLEKLAKQLCIVKEAAAPLAEQVEGLCTGDPDGYTRPKPNGTP
jgi:hypothetical protein